MSQTKHIPPKLATRLLSWFVRDELAEEVLGDLEEKFFSDSRKKSAFRSKLTYWYQVLNYLRPFAIRKKRIQSYNYFDMYLNYFKTGYRNLLRNMGYSFINIGGLAVGMAVSMLIGLWIFDELSFDRYHENHERVAQVMQHQTINGQVFTGAALPIPIEDEIRNHYSADFKYIAMASWTGDYILSHEDKNYVFSGNYMGIDMPKILSLQMIYGTQEGLSDMHAILISKTVSDVFFGNEDPVGQEMKLNNDETLLVTGVYEDLPHNTSMSDLKFIVPWELMVATQSWVQHAKNSMQWSNNSFQMYVQLADFSDFESASERIAKAKYNKVPEEQKQFQARLSLNPMDEWHLQNHYVNGVKDGGLVVYVWMFGAVGVFVLILACINFMNLSTARSEKRAKEVGIRKSIGSVRWQLINQFLSESLLVVIIAFVLALLLVLVSIPSFNLLAAKEIVFPFTNGYFWAACGVFILVTGLVAGSYPAFYLSSFQPVRVLKGTFKANKSASVFRRSLVVLQFSVSVTLIIGTLIVHQQIKYSMDRPLGYDPGGLVMLRMSSADYEGKYDVIREEVKKTGAVLEMAQSSSPLTSIWSNSGGFYWEGKDPDDHMDFAVVRVTHDYGNTVGWEVTQGRDFSRSFTDSLSFVINESAVKRMGLDDPIGKTVRWGGEDGGEYFKIVGVVKDMLMDSPFKKTRECIYLLDYRYTNWIEFKLNPDKPAQEALGDLQNVFAGLLPNVPFDYQFVDREYSKKFEAEQRIQSLAGIFAVLAVLISCLGLFGLAAFVAEQRSKEIGIRKVMGASVLNIWTLVSREFIFLVLVASFIAMPVAYYFLNAWLQNYEYRVSIGWWVFAFALAGAMFITISTVSFQAIKSAVANPIKSLRSE